jgi:anthranilate phosphoribosyltransferase
VSDDFKAFIAKVAAGNALTRDEASHAFDRMMSGEATPSQMGAMLMAMRVRGETVDEITGAASTMRAKMTKWPPRLTPSMWSAPAATPPAPTTCPPAPR